MYQTIKSELSERSLAYWESHQDILQRNLHSGRLELFWNKMGRRFRNISVGGLAYKFIASQTFRNNGLILSVFSPAKHFALHSKNLQIKRM